MTEKESISVLAVLKAAYPQQLNKLSEAEANATIQIWLIQFNGIPGDIVMLAAQKLIATSVYFPTVAEIKAKIKSLHWEAWGAIQQHEQELEMGIGRKLSESVLQKVKYVYENTYDQRKLNIEQGMFELIGAKYNQENELIEDGVALLELNISNEEEA